MKRTIFLGTLVIGLIGLSLSACARHKKETVLPPAQPAPAFTQPLTVQQAQAPAPTHRSAGNLDYVKK